MPLRVELSDVFNLLYKRLRIKQSSAQNIEPSYLPESINLVYAINGLVDRKVSGLPITEFLTGTVNINSTGLKTIYHCSKGYDYILRAIDLYCETGDFLLTQLRAGMSAQFSTIIWSQDASSEINTHLFIPLPLPEGYELITNVSTFTLAGYCRYKMLFSRQLP